MTIHAPTVVNLEPCTPDGTTAVAHLFVLDDVARFALATPGGAMNFDLDQQRARYLADALEALTKPHDHECVETMAEDVLRKDVKFPVQWSFTTFDHLVTWRVATDVLTAVFETGVEETRQAAELLRAFSTKVRINA